MQTIARAALPYSSNAPVPAEARPLRVDPGKAGMDPVRVARAIDEFRSEQAAGVFPGGHFFETERLVVRMGPASGSSPAWP